MPECTGVLQTEKDLFQPEIRPKLPENCQISAIFLTQNTPKMFGHPPVN